MKILLISFVCLVGALALAISVSGQEDSPRLPGDPVGPDDLVFVDLEVGSSVSCGVTKANNIRCWGQLTHGPVRAEGFTDVAVGRSHTCGLKIDGTVQCWGSNTQGQLNVPLEDGSPSVFSEIVAHADHSCGLKSDGSAVCWGRDRSGQSSGGAHADYPFDYSNVQFSEIALAPFRTCGLLKGGETAGEIRCWGRGNTVGQNEPPDVQPPITKFKSIRIQEYLTCGIIDGGTRDGEVTCWGDNRTGVLDASPTGVTFDQISVGLSHGCGVTPEDAVVCWGGNDDPFTSSSEDLRQAVLPDEYTDTTFSKVGASDYFTCAIKDGQNDQTEGMIVCWGYDLSLIH